MADLNKIIDELSNLTVVEAAELLKKFYEKCGFIQDGITFQRKL